MRVWWRFRSNAGLIRLAFIALLGLACSEGRSTAGPVHAPALAGGSCTECSIELTQVAVLRAPADSAGISFSARAVRLPEGWLVAPTDDGSRYIEFDAEGKLVGYRGRRGQGPGEFVWINGVVPGDSGSVSVFDIALRRLTRIGAGGAVRATHPLDYALGSVPVRIGPSQFIHSSIVTTPGRLGKPVHVTDSTGRIIRSFGGESVPDGAMPGLLMHRVLRLAADSTVRVAHRLDPTVEQWTLGGELLESRRFAVDWFPGGTGQTTGASSPRIDDLLELDDGLWVLLVQLDLDNARAGSAVSQREESGTRLDAAEMNRRFESRALVVDVRSGAHVGTFALGRYCSHFTAGKGLACVTPDPDGATVLEISVLDLRGFAR